MPLPRPSALILTGSTTPEKSADMTEEEDPGSRGDGVAEQIQHLRGIFYRLRKPVTFFTTMP